jgi:hypothetical protein
MSQKMNMGCVPSMPEYEALDQVRDAQSIIMHDEPAEQKQSATIPAEPSPASSPAAHPVESSPPASSPAPQPVEASPNPPESPPAAKPMFRLVVPTHDVLKCPVCLDLPFDAMIGKCGHTVCGFCVVLLDQKKCPVCRIENAYVPNYMLRQLLEHKELEAERKRVLASHRPETVIRVLQSKYPTFSILFNNLSDFNTTAILTHLDQQVFSQVGWKCTKIVQVMEKYDTELTVIVFSRPHWSYHIRNIDHLTFAINDVVCCVLTVAK